MKYEVCSYEYRQGQEVYDGQYYTLLETDDYGEAEEYYNNLIHQGVIGTCVCEDSIVDSLHIYEYYDDGTCNLIDSTY